MTSAWIRIAVIASAFLIGCAQPYAPSAILAETTNGSSAVTVEPTPTPTPTSTPTSTPIPAATSTPNPAPTATPTPGGSAGIAPVIRLSATGKLTARPRSTLPRPTDFVGSGADFTFQGVVVDDGKVVDCKWKQLSGPTAVTITDQFTTPEPANEDGSPSGNIYCGIRIKNYGHGTYVFEAEATDDSGLKSRSTVELTFPVYDRLGEGPLLVSDSSVGEVILPPNFSRFVFDPATTFAISASIYSDKLRDYDIRQVSGPNVSALRYKSTQYSTLSSGLRRVNYGSYEYRFDITDVQGRTAMESLKVTFVKPLKDPAVVNVTEPVQPQVFNSRHGDVVYAIDDPKTTILGIDHYLYTKSLPTYFNWKQISGPTLVNFTYKLMDANFLIAHVDNLDYGTYAFEGSIADENGNLKSETIKVTYPRPMVATGVNQNPQVTLSKDHAIVVRPNCYLTGPVNHIESKEDFAFQGVAYDDGKISSFKWTQLSGPNQVNIFSEYNAGSYYGLKFRNHTYGTYEFKLEVTDDQGLKGSDTIKITFPRGL